jgi:hypothetical protein
MTYKDFSKEIEEKIEKIKKKVLSGELSLLDIELASLFEDIKNSLNIYNINRYSMTFKNAFQLLSQKFEELKIFLNYLNNKDKFLTYLKRNPSDLEIYELFKDCWRVPFTIESLSLSFLEYSKDRLITEKQTPIKIDFVEKSNVREDFLLEIPDKKFTDKMMSFFENIKKKLPCSYDEIFMDENEQLKIYEHFVFLLHLLQLGKIKYQKETKFLYL